MEEIDKKYNVLKDMLKSNVPLIESREQFTEDIFNAISKAKQAEDTGTFREEVSTGRIKHGLKRIVVWTSSIAAMLILAFMLIEVFTTKNISIQKDKTIHIPDIEIYASANKKYNQNLSFSEKNAYFQEIYNEKIKEKVKREAMLRRNPLR